MGECAKCEAVKASAVRSQESRTVRQACQAASGTRDMTVYIDTTGTTYTHLQRGRQFNFFSLSLSDRNNPHAYLGCPSLLFQFAYREARGDMTKTAPCPLAREIREPCSIGTSSGSSLGYRGESLLHKVMIDYAIGRRNRSTSLLSFDVCFTRLVG